VAAVLITGFARATAEVSAALNLAPMGSRQPASQAEALDTRLPAVAALLAEGKTDWRTVQIIIARTDLVDTAVIAELDASSAERIAPWQCGSRRRIIHAVEAAVHAIDAEAAQERRVTADTERRLSVTALPNGVTALPNGTARVRGEPVGPGRGGVRCAVGGDGVLAASTAPAATRSPTGNGATTCAEAWCCSKAANTAPAPGALGSTTPSNPNTSPPTGNHHPHHPQQTTTHRSERRGEWS
jgi:Domain of unknown function (DUF222)